MWVRGLKPLNPFNPFFPIGVAPYVGAWIETEEFMHFEPTYTVAPYVGAWIETYEGGKITDWFGRTLCGCVD